MADAVAAVRPAFGRRLALLQTARPMRLPTRLLAALVAAPVLLAATASAQTVLRPGHPDLMTGGLTLDSHVEAVRITEPSPRDIGVVRHQVTRDGDRVTLVTQSSVPTMGGDTEITSEFAWPSLRPIHSQRSPQSIATYDGTRVTGVYGRGDWDPLPFDITLQDEPFQPEVLPILARALPFRAGYTARVPTFAADVRLRDVQLAVVGQEDFRRADGSTASTWVVEETSTGRGSRTRRYYVDADTRDLVALSFSPQEGTAVVTEPTTEEALALAAADRAAGDALRPGSDVLATDALAGYSQDYVVRLVQPGQQDIGTQTRRLTIDREAGTATLEVSIEVAMAGQRTSETVVVAYPSLRPISSRADDNGAVVDLAYTDAGVRRTEEANADGPEELTFEEPVFDTSFVPEVARLLPFEEGYQVQVQTFNRNGPAATTLTVIGQEEDEGRPVWLVNAQPEQGPLVEFAVDAETRALRRMKLQPQAGVVVHIVPVDG